MFVSCSDDDATFLNEIRVSQSYVAIDKNGGEVSIDIAATACEECEGSCESCE